MPPLDKRVYDTLPAVAPSFESYLGVYNHSDIDKNASKAITLGARRAHPENYVDPGYQKPESATKHFGSYTPPLLGTSQSTASPSLPSPNWRPIYADISTDIFSNCNNFQLGSLNYYAGQGSQTIANGWDMLLNQTVPNALYDSYALFDSPQCDEDTRLEVIAEIMNWVQSDEPSTQRLLCITGAAGAGKSAIQQTIAVKCAKLGILGASFFFSAGDRTRNTVEPFVATIAYQLGRTSPILRKSINDAVDVDPLIFTKSLHKQMDALIVGPIRQRSSSLNTVPHVILIDGLDECGGEDTSKQPTGHH